ncbi:hypothetical protein ABID56_000408 [Alkalibacillus flavidus]|uniref:DUF2487 family protein n=1 Tax=Alkalibacillus flavidus TaxID=546021 RepID=A0ABV2KSH8_9BACI
MKWIYNDIDQYVQAKEYIDTAVMALVPFAFDDDESLKKYAFQSEAMYILMSQIEKQYKGRVLLLPVYHYPKQNTLESETERLNNMIDQMHEQQPFQHTLLFTFDNKWRKQQRHLNAELIWLPAPTEGDLNQVETQQILQSQANELQTLIQDQWQS